MSTIHWLNDINGAFTNPADWRGGIVPGASDNAILGAAGSAFTVTSGVSETVRSVRLSSNATLSLTGGTFDALEGTGSGANAGVILVGAGATLVCGGTVTNAAGGVIMAGDGAFMRLEPGAHLRGGTLASAGSGTFVAKAAYVGEAGGHLVVDARLKLMGVCTLDGEIENDGVILQAAGAGQLSLGAVTLTGGGVFDMALYGGFEGDQDTTLVLASGTIRGAASVSVGALTIGAAGLMVNDTAHDLVLSAGASMTNDGTIESSGAGLVLIDSPLVNDGTLSVQAGVMEAITAVSGDGVVTIGGGTLDLGAAFDQAVTFTGGGALNLAQSRMFTHSVTGFSTKGRTTLDLEDIHFVDAGEATFSGTASGGVLTVTDGAHTAHITLKGDYRGVTFVASKDGHGGTDVVARKADAFAAPVGAFVAAMAGLASPGGQVVHADVVGRGREYLLAPGRATLA
jgi:hypothetical protein